MFMQNFDCTHLTCLLAYAKTIEGLAIVKLLKVLVKIKTNKEGSTPRAVEIKNLLKHLNNLNQKHYKFTRLVKCRLQIDEEKPYYFRAEIINIDSPSILRYIESTNTVEIYFTNLS